MQQQLAAMPGWAPTALIVTAFAAAALPLAVYVGRRLRTRRWRLAVGTRAWRVAVALLVLGPMLAGFAGALADLVADAQRLAGQDSERALPQPGASERVLTELQRMYEVNLVLAGSTLPYRLETIPVEVLSPGAAIAGRSCELGFDAERARELVGSDVDWLPEGDFTPAEETSVYPLLCDGQVVRPQGALLGVPVQTEVVERAWPAQRAPRALAGFSLAGAAMGLVVVFLAYVLPLVDLRGATPSRGETLLADLRERVRRDPAERDRVVDAVVAVVHENDAARAGRYATMPLDEVLLRTPDDAELTDETLLTRYLMATGGLDARLIHGAPFTERELSEVDLAVARQSETMDRDPAELARVRRYAADLLDQVNTEARAQREAGLAGTFVATEVDRDAVELSDDVLREHLVATGAIGAVEMAAPGSRAYWRGLLGSLAFAPVIALMAWVMSQDDGSVQWRYEAVVSVEAAAEFAAHYEAMGIDVALTTGREETEPVLYFMRAEGTRGADSCVGDVVSGRALLRCGPSVEARSWT